MTSTGRWWTSGPSARRCRRKARNMSPIVPRASISGRALVAVVAIMTFLASITTGAVLLVSASAAEWQSEVASEITMQVRPQAGRDLERDVTQRRRRCGRSRHRPGQAVHQGRIGQVAGAVARQRAVDRPVAGAARHRRAVQPGTTLDLPACAAAVTQVAPSASVDDHRAWIERMRSMTGATVLPASASSCW